jgi:hypothetical protein
MQLQNETLTESDLLAQEYDFMVSTNEVMDGCGYTFPQSSAPRW